jgi:hypothetical protein
MGSVPPGLPGLTHSSLMRRIAAKKAARARGPLNDGLLVVVLKNWA